MVCLDAKAVGRDQSIQDFIGYIGYLELSTTSTWKPLEGFKQALYNLANFAFQKGPCMYKLYYKKMNFIKA